MGSCIKFSVKQLILTVFLFTWGFSNNVIAQIKIYPHSKPASPIQSTKTNTTARTKVTEALTLPFWDDFSNPYGMYPDTLRWKNSYSIWVNDGLAINQPTYNVATFDGLDSVGISYNPDDVLVIGYTDQLTSQPIDLSETKVSLPERGSVYLSFFYQWQGNGEAPDSDDYIELGLKDDKGEWKTMLTIFPQPDFDRTVFYEKILQVDSAYFFHNDFQFRFRSFGRKSGPYDTWNLDYVYLNKGRSPSDNSYPERAIASDLTSLFGEYRAIPYRHFKINPTLAPVTFDVKNLKNSTTPVSINYRATATFTNFTKTDTLKYATTLVASEGVKGTNGIMFPLERTTVSLSTLPNPNDPLQFNVDADSVDITIKTKVISSDSIDEERTKFAPINLQVNDTISSTFYLRNYYAYDDGVAEYAAGLIQPGNLIAYQFNMLSEPDTLLGFNVYFPPYAIAANQTISFTIYHDENGKPGEVWQQIPSRSIKSKSLNEFQLIEFKPAMLINETKFYIGWKQPAVGKVLVGLDIDNNTGNKIFVNENGFWYQNQVVKGSLMVRPIFGKGILDVIDGVENDLNFSVFPNPNNGGFYIEGHYDALKIFSIAGNEIAFESEKIDNRTFIQMNKTQGLYLLRITTGNVTKTQKIVINR